MSQLATPRSSVASPQPSKSRTRMPKRWVAQQVFRRIAIRGDQVVEVDVYPAWAEAFRLYLRPEWVQSVPRGAIGSGSFPALGLRGYEIVRPSAAQTASCTTGPRPPPADPW